MARVEGGLVPSGVGYGRGVPSSAEGVWGSVVSSPSGAREGAPAENSVVF